MGSSSSRTPRLGPVRLRPFAVLAIVALAMTLLTPAGVAASTAGTSDAQRSLAAQGTIPVMEPPVEDPNWNVTSGVRHFVFACPDGYPGGEASLAEFFADCELLHVYSCLEQSPWSLIPANPGCESPRRP